MENVSCYRDPIIARDDYNVEERQAQLFRGVGVGCPRLPNGSVSRH